MTRRTRWESFVPLMLPLALLLLIPQVVAQAFSPSTIRIVVPTTPSTPPDIISRVIAQQLTADKDWNVVVENKPGAWSRCSRASRIS